MTIQEAVHQIQEAPLPERIEAIEQLLASLKQELFQSEPLEQPRGPFQIRTFDLGADIQVDRDEIYTDRVFP